MSAALETLLRNRAKQAVLDERRYQSSLEKFIETLRKASQAGGGKDRINTILNQAASTPEQKAALGSIMERLDRVLETRHADREEA